MVSQVRPKMRVLLKAPAKTQWSSRIALKHRHLKTELGGVLLSPYAVLGPGDPKDLTPGPARPLQSRAIATDAAAGGVEAVEAVAGNEVASAGSSVDLAEAVSETIIENHIAGLLGFFSFRSEGFLIYGSFFRWAVQAVSVRSITYPFSSSPISTLRVQCVRLVHRSLSRCTLIGVHTPVILLVPFQSLTSILQTM